MINLAITIIVGLCVIGIVAWIARAVVRHMGGPDIVWQVIVAVLCLLLLAYMFGGGDRLVLVR